MSGHRAGGQDAALRARHVFNGLHGRALPAGHGDQGRATRDLTVIADGGDGDMYGEGGNHLLHAIRRNPDITLLRARQHGLRPDQGPGLAHQPTGMKTPVQVDGVFAEPFNPLAVAIALDALVRGAGLRGDMERDDGEIIKQAIAHKGFALVDIFQPCVTFNKVNTYRNGSRSTRFTWTRPTTPPTASTPSPGRSKRTSLLSAFYRSPARTTFEAGLEVYKRNQDPLFKRSRSMDGIRDFMKKKYA